MINTTDHGQIREIQMDRPPVNAMNGELLTGIRDAVKAAADDGCRAIVLSGNEKIFSAGLDLPTLLSHDDDKLEEVFDIFFEAMAAVASSPIPVAAAITGHSPAGGAVFATFCDWRVMADGTFGFGFNEVAVGLTVPSIVYKAIVHNVGAKVANLMSVTGRMIGPREAMAMGLVDWVAQPEEVVAKAIEFCEELIALPRRAMDNTRTMARRELVEYVNRNHRRDANFFFEEWKRPETQAVLKDVMKQLKERKKKPN
jgi:enoyl-CoA hydratase/carnithine racemase